MNSVPVRYAAVHQSFGNSPILHLVRAINALMMQAGNRIRLVLHSEDDWEMRYKLLGYGIPIDCE